MDILSQFCNSHCQKVNMEKSNIMFSGNTLVSVRNLIFSKSGFMESSSLDTYLRVPLTGKILRIKYYSYLNKKVQSKLTTQKSNQLSFAGRATLAKAVTEALPMYTMMIMATLEDCIHNIEKCQISFLQGDNEDKKHFHSVRWSIISKEKHQGGLRLRYLGIMNKAYLAKLGQNLKTKYNTLWCNILKRKYSFLRLSSGSMCVKSYESCLWKSLVELRQNLDEISYQEVGNDKNIRVCEDAWVSLGLKLKDHVFHQLPS